METKKLTKTLNSKFNRPSKSSYIYKEVNPTMKLEHKCLTCGRTFSAKSRYNKVCELCKLSDNWKTIW